MCFHLVGAYVQSMRNFKVGRWKCDALHLLNRRLMPHTRGRFDAIIGLCKRAPSSSATNQEFIIRDTEGSVEVAQGAKWHSEPLTPVWPLTPRVSQRHGTRPVSRRSIACFICSHKTSTSWLFRAMNAPRCCMQPPSLHDFT